VRVVGLAQVREGRPGEDERPAHVDVEHEVEALGRDVRDRREVDRRGVVDDDVHAAPALDGLRDEGVDLRLVAHVADDGQRLAAGLLDGLGGRVDRPGELGMGLVRLGQERDAGALARDGDGDGQPDAAAPARHDDDAVLQW
jgi:hypothetical protein